MAGALYLQPDRKVIFCGVLAPLAPRWTDAVASRSLSRLMLWHPTASHVWRLQLYQWRTAKKLVTW